MEPRRCATHCDERLPAPGERWGWGIAYGDRLQYRMTITEGQHDLAYALQRARDVGGQLLPLAVCEGCERCDVLIP